MRTFQDSSQVLNYLQSQYGSTNYRDWQSIRRQFYSHVAYPEAGISSATFFGVAVGSQNKQLTNMPKAGSFGQNHFLLKRISCDIYINAHDIDGWAGTDADTLYSDIVNGFCQAGVLEFVISSRKFLQIPKPFLYAPPAYGAPEVHSAGLGALTLTEGTPNTLLTSRSGVPYATLGGKNKGQYLVDPNILIEAEQNFQCNINFPSGLVPVIGTDVTDDSTNPLYISVTLDGVLFRPLQ